MGPVQSVWLNTTDQEQVQQHLVARVLQDIQQMETQDDHHVHVRVTSIISMPWTFLILWFCGLGDYKCKQMGMNGYVTTNPK